MAIKNARASNKIKNILEIIAADCFAFHGKKTDLEGLSTSSCKYLKGIYCLFYCLSRNVREGNSESWKPQNSNLTVVSVVKCTTALPETQCCLDFFFSVNRDNNKNFLTALTQKVKKEGLSFLLQNCNNFLY